MQEFGELGAELSGASSIEEPSFRLDLKELLEATPTMLDVFFDLDKNRWRPWTEMPELHHGPRRNQLHSRSELSDAAAVNGCFYDFVPTADTARLSFLIEGLIMAKINLVLVGEASSGKSWLMRNALTEQLPKAHGTRLVIVPVILYQNSVVSNTQKDFEAPLEKRRKGRCGPPLGKNIVYFVEDLTMGKKDKHGRSDVLELLRQLSDFGQCYDLRTVEAKRIEDVSVAATMTCSPNNSFPLLGGRHARHFAFLGYPCGTGHLTDIFKHLSNSFTQSWTSTSAKGAMTKIIEATIGLKDKYNRLVKSTANRQMYVFNIRHMYRILHGMACLSPRSSPKDVYDVARLWNAEAYRTLVDRVEARDEKRMFAAIIRQEVERALQLSPAAGRLPTKSGRPYYTHLWKGEPGRASYVELDKVKRLRPFLAEQLAEYHDQHPEARVSISLFDFMIEYIIKVVRAL